MSKDKEGISDKELEQRLRALRDINRRHAAGEISEAERRRLHDEIIPGFSKKSHRHDADGHHR